MNALTGDVDFIRAKFIGDTWFGEATFTGYAWFGKATFTGDAVMAGATAAPTQSCMWPTGWTVDDRPQGTAVRGDAPSTLPLVPVPVVLVGAEVSDGLQSGHGGSRPG
ncbi:pentapeptide repeat-containing protein [Lentzea flaviverrucosa]|uniref:pentapeptide repeat-containing protein n=1 Tax=Lentzea flaviverrucosa TaxID=200379 RepID=UPI000B7DA75E|nr:pentapeptide repeat-containing protein [Lentzea flaviverrucosa]